MYILIKFVNRQPYKYKMQNVCKETQKKKRKIKVWTPKIIKYLGKASMNDLTRYYKGKKYRHLLKTRG